MIRCGHIEDNSEQLLQQVTTFRKPRAELSLVSYAMARKKCHNGTARDIALSRPMALTSKGCCKGNNYEQNRSPRFSGWTTETIDEMFDMASSPRNSWFILCSNTCWWGKQLRTTTVIWQKLGEKLQGSKESVLRGRRCAFIYLEEKQKCHL